VTKREGDAWTTIGGDGRDLTRVFQYVLGIRLEFNDGQEGNQLSEIDYQIFYSGLLALAVSCSWPFWDTMSGKYFKTGNWS
jgi:hypothetical protein